MCAAEFAMDLARLWQLGSTYLAMPPILLRSTALRFSCCSAEPVLALTMQSGPAGFQTPVSSSLAVSVLN